MFEIIGLELYRILGSLSRYFPAQRQWHLAGSRDKTGEGSLGPLSKAYEVPPPR